MKIAVGQGSCGIAAGAMKAYEILNSNSCFKYIVVEEREINEP